MPRIVSPAGFLERAGHPRQPRSFPPAGRFSSSSVAAPRAFKEPPMSMSHRPKRSRRPFMLIPALLAAPFAFDPRTHVEARRATQAQLGGPRRYLTALSTDKPIYRPGETVWVRGVVLSAFDHTPLRDDAFPQVTVKGPRGETVAAAQSATRDSVWAFSWQVPADQAGGEYTLLASYPREGHAPAERKFDVRVYRAPRLKSQIVFLRDGYGPGDRVTATVEVTRAEGGVPSGARVTAVARVDGAEAARVAGTVDGRGRCTVSFDLPKPIARGEGALSFAIEDGGVVETAAKTIPILLQTLDLTLGPEGGDLAAGVANRVYFEARTPAHKPADIAGVIVDQRGTVVARFRSEHEGRGRFLLTPEAGARYRLRVDQPAGIKTTWPLPAAVAGGVALRAGRDTTPSGAPVRLLLASGRDQKVTVTLSHREVEIASVAVALEAGQTPAEIYLASRGADGVLTATVWNAEGRPVAERLIFREPEKALKIDLRTDKPRYAPGDTVHLTARATRDGRPVEAVVGLTVTDDAVLQMIDKREQAPALPAMVLLEPEVRELADAAIYLDAKNPKAPLAVDLLLGTQGWRRFASMTATKLIERYGDDARRALAYRTAPPPPVAMAVAAAVGKGAGRGAVDRKAAFADDLLENALGGRKVREEAPMGAAIPLPAPPAAPAPVAAKAEAPRPVAVAAAALAPAASEPLPRPAPAMPMAAPPAEAAPRPARDVAADDWEGAGERKRARRVAAARPHHGRDGFVAARPLIVVAREYAHELRPGRQPADRLDFTETLFWQAAARTNRKTGEVTVRFALSDSVTSFKATAGGFDADGALGAATSSVESAEPFFVEPKLPLEVTAGDTIQLPVNLVNGTTSPLHTVLTANVTGGLSLGGLPALDLGAGARVRRILQIGVGAAATTAELTLRGAAGPYADKVTRTLVIKPNGFPFRVAAGGLTSAGGAVGQTVTIPAGVAPGSLTTSVAVYPTPLANMTQALARLIQDPYGCFEQTSSTTYPLTMAQQYFTSHTGVDPQLVATAQQKLDAGYKRLVSFECSENGYEWFGENPGHEALTAYGLLHFNDMAKVREVDPAMIVRSREWLLRQRDGHGGFERKRRALHSWVEDRDSSNGYILWSLLESGQRGLDAELASFQAAAARSDNSYVAALGANVMALAGRTADARKLMERLASRQGARGVVEGATTSIVGSGGEALAIETTALAVLAWLRDPAFAAPVERSMKYLAESCQDGRFGSTQSTVLALRAIVAYDQARARPKAPGSLHLYVDGTPAGAPVTFDAATQGTLKLPDVAERLTAGTHRIEIKMDGGAPMPYSIAVAYSALTPDSARDCKVGLDVKLSRATVAEGELIEADATIANRTGQPVPTPIAIIGLPGGLEPRHDQLKELVKRGVVDSYEVVGRDVVLYWRGLDPGQKVQVPLSLVAAVPGRYTGPASRAYLYYTDELKTWASGLAVTITAK
jgi:hypothetical protein